MGDRTPSLTTIHKTLITHASDNTCASIYRELRRLVAMARLCAIEAVTAKLQQRGDRLYSDELRPMYVEKPWLKEVIGNLRQFINTVPELAFHARTDADNPYVTLAGICEKGAEATSACGKGEMRLLARYMALPKYGFEIFTRP